MSLYENYKRRMQVDTCSTGKNYPTLGEKLKSDSDRVMELTWDNDVQSKKAYIYDYWHDDHPDIKDHMTYENTVKTCIDIKFIVKSYQSVDKDQVDYYIMFKPSQKIEFTEDDELFYYENDFHKKYLAEFPIGLYIDIPDDRGVYRKWLIVLSEPANQFPKYLVLPINYRFMWIENTGKERVKRKMWSVLKSQNSYNSGLWTDLRFTSQENQDKVWLPINSITDKIWYTNSTDTNMRVLVSAPTDKAIAWNISKVENAKPFGIQKLTLYQDFFDQHRDYIEKDKNGNIIGMWADYYDSSIEPTDPDTPSTTPSSITAKISASTSSVKVGGSFRTLTTNLFNESNEDITSEYENSLFTWTCNIDGEDWTDIVTWRFSKKFNQTKLSFPLNKDQLGKILSVKCTITKDDADPIESDSLQLEISS